MPLDEALGNVQIFVGSDTIEFQTALENSYAQSIELKRLSLGNLLTNPRRTALQQ